MIEAIDARLRALRLLAGTNAALADVDFDQALDMTALAAQAVAQHTVGYGLLIAEKPSREATNQLLAELRIGRWRPAAWTAFLGHCAQRSLGQARLRPVAAAELTAFHAGMIALTRGSRC